MQNILEKVKVIYEDEGLIVIDKPSGLVVHSDGRTEEKSLIDWLENYCNENKIDTEEQKNIGNKHTLDSARYVDRWGILNRLDRETSGIIMIAKKQDIFEKLQKDWHENVEKKYIAVLHGELETLEKKFEINEPLSRHKKDPRIWVLKSDEGSRVTSRNAKTLCEVVKVVEVIGQKFTIVNFWPITGRTHQLRLHAKFLKHPILGDKKYSFGGIDNILNKDKENRLMLHAISINFIHPKTEKKMEIKTENPDFGEFKSVL
jgi:23S rRNA pseudouridine1911/1915/1917 synthase